MLNFLSSRLQKSIKKMNAKTTLTEENVQVAIREVKIALLEADVNLLVVKRFINAVKEKAVGQKVVGSLTHSQQMLKIFREELVNVLGKTAKELNLKRKPSIIMMVGLQGSGKTTSAAKIAWYLRKKKIVAKPLLIAADIYRPAAIKQLVVLGKQIQVDVFERGDKVKPQEIVQQGLDYAKMHDYDLVIIDTAGRLSINEELMREVVDIKKLVNPSEIFLTIDALVGQDIINVAETFHANLHLTGTVVSKLDSDARGGACLSIANLLAIPIQFIGVGEAVSEIQLFSPDRMAERILGMGDIYALIDKAEEVIDHKKAEKITKRFMGGSFDLNDLLEQLKQVKKMGKFSKIIALLPGANKITPDQVNSAEEKLRLFEILINSMTMQERKNPQLLKQAPRKKRIIVGSGRSNQEYNRLVSEFEKMRAQVKAMSKSFQKGDFRALSKGLM